MKTPILKALMLMPVLAVFFSCNKPSPEMSADLSKSWNELYPLNKGSYLSSEYLEFKEENFRTDLYTDHELSEKVKFKAFVKNEQMRSAN
jgi:hypothetical protein